MTNKHLILILLIPLSEAKAIFYHVDKEVSWYLFSDHARQMCNVVEDYSNIIIFGVVFYFMAYTKIDKKTKNTASFLFILNALDLIHLGLFDKQYFVILKVMLAFAIFTLCYKLKPSY